MSRLDAGASIRHQANTWPLFDVTPCHDLEAAPPPTAVRADLWIGIKASTRGDTRYAIAHANPGAPPTRCPRRRQLPRRTLTLL